MYFEDKNSGQDVLSPPEAESSSLTWETLGAKIIQAGRAAACLHLIESAVSDDGEFVGGSE